MDTILIAALTVLWTVTAYVVWKVAYGRGLLDGDEAASLIHTLIPKQPRVTVTLYQTADQRWHFTVCPKDGPIGRPSLASVLSFESSVAAHDAAKRFFPLAKPSIGHPPER